MITTLASVLGVMVASAACLTGPLLELHDRMPQRPALRIAAVFATNHNDLGDFADTPPSGNINTAAPARPLAAEPVRPS